MPLVQLPSKSIVDMHELGETEEDGEEGSSYYRLSDEVQGKQLMLNYCYGHPESSMLFFPSGSVSALINHSIKPNSKLQWSNHPAHQRQWYNYAPKDLLAQDTLYIGLHIEIVALRDIKEGEEITIDYGPEWVQAWDEHVKQWKKKLDNGEISKEWPIRAVDLNEEYQGKTFKSPKELDKDPYPSNVMLKCFMQVNAGMSPEKIDGRPVREWAEPKNGIFDSDTLDDCVVIDYEKADSSSGTMPFNYTVSLARESGASTLVKNVPHRAFVFVDKPGTGDQFTSEAFRHYIGIPDEIFPEGPWRDLKKAES